MFEVGTIVRGKYRIDRLIGRGGMGVVAVATHLQLGQQVAIKVLHEIYATDATSRDRFLREARTPMQLKSDHVCRVLDVDADDAATPFIVMELLAGSDLASLVARQPLPPHIAVDYVLQAMIAIAEAHALGIVHRDLKPANLFVTRRIDGSPLVKVLDFGIAKAPAATDNKLTHTTAVMGSPGYMSPEQLRSARDVDARTDIWALGAILYEIASGRVPFPATSVTELAMKVAVDPPAPLDIAPAYRAVVWRCLEKDVTKRYQDVAALARDLAPLGSPGADATAALIARLLGVPAAGYAPTLAPVASNAPTAAGTMPPPVATTLGNAAGSRTMPAPAKRTRWLVIGGGAVLAAAAIVGGVLASGHGEPRGAGSGSDVIVVVRDDAGETVTVVVHDEHAADAATLDTPDAATLDVDFAGFAGEVEGDIAAGYCDRAQKLLAGYHGPHPTTVLAADVAKCSARAAAANAGRAADLIGHPPAIVPAPPKSDDPHVVTQFGAYLMNKRCKSAGAMLGYQLTTTPERSTKFSDCITRQAQAVTYPEAPESEAYLVGMAADEASPEAGTKLLDDMFFVAVTRDCDQHDIVNARKALKHLTSRRKAAIDQCLSRNGMTVP